MQVHELITALLNEPLMDGALEVEVENIEENSVYCIDEVKYDGSSGRRRVVIFATEQ